MMTINDKLELLKLADEFKITEESSYFRITMRNKIGYDLKYDKYVIDYILNIIKDEKEYGARPIMRAIQDEIEDKITDLLLEKDYENGYVFNVTYPQRLVTPSSLMPGIVEEEPIYDTLQTS